MNIFKKIRILISGLFNKKANLDLNNSFDNEMEAILKTYENDIHEAEDIDIIKAEDTSEINYNDVKYLPVEPNVNNNPLEPYKHPYEDWNDTYSKEGRTLTEEDFNTTFNQYINLKSFMNEEKAPILKKIYEDSKFIYDALQPIRDLELNYTLDLTGGAVRDFVLNKHNFIKDLDFMVSFAWNTRITQKLIIEKTDITKEQLDAVQFEQAYDMDEQKSKLLEVCMSRTSDLGPVYFHDFKKRIHILKKSDDEYKDTTITDRLISVVKTKGEKTNYPIDLLLTDFIKPQFLNDFDFNICKSSMCIVNRVYKKDMPKDYSHLISRFNAEMNFWADVVNKKLTYNCGARTQHQIDASFNNHLVRIKNKYPDYQVNIINDTALNYEYAKALHRTQILDAQLNKKEENSNNKKMKI